MLRPTRASSRHVEKRVPAKGAHPSLARLGGPAAPAKCSCQEEKFPRSGLLECDLIIQPLNPHVIVDDCYWHVFGSHTNSDLDLLLFCDCTARSVLLTLVGAGGRAARPPRTPGRGRAGRRQPQLAAPVRARRPQDAKARGKAQASCPHHLPACPPRAGGSAQCLRRAKGALSR